MDPGARAELAARGYDGSAHRARQFNRSWFGDYDLVRRDGPAEPG